MGASGLPLKGTEKIVRESEVIARDTDVVIPKTFSLKDRYSYATRYIADSDEFLRQVLDKKIIPHQLEVQPGRLSGKKLCWLSCPYCYGGSSENTGERLEAERLKNIIDQSAKGPHGGIKKVIFAGYATDPLNYEHIDELVEVAIKNRQVIGFHTKALKIKGRLIDLLSSGKTAALSYFSVSVDAGTGKTYGEVHGAAGNTKMYQRVLSNITELAKARDANGSKIDISATYLVTTKNANKQDANRFIEDFLEAGVDLLRFSFPQMPRGDGGGEDTLVPGNALINETMSWLQELADQYSTPKRPVLVANYDDDLDISSERQLPCVARFVFPSIGYDGWLGHCSESAAPHFRNMSLGDLSKRDFWDLFYDYDTEDFWNSMQSDYRKMCQNDCRCDRKEHAVNQLFSVANQF